MAKRPILVASNVLLNCYSQVLMGRRKDSGLWEIPGGKVEDEPLIYAGIREMEEETGIRLHGFPAVFGVADTWGAFGSQGLQSYVCVGLLWEHQGLKRARLVEGKHDKWEWFGLWEDLPSDSLVTVGTRLLFSQLETFLKMRSDK